MTIGSMVYVRLLVFTCCLGTCSQVLCPQPYRTELNMLKGKDWQQDGDISASVGTSELPTRLYDDCESWAPADDVHLA